MHIACCKEAKQPKSQKISQFLVMIFSLFHHHSCIPLKYINIMTLFILSLVMFGSSFKKGLATSTVDLTLHLLYHFWFITFGFTNELNIIKTKEYDHLNGRRQTNHLAFYYLRFICIKIRQESKEFTEVKSTTNKQNEAHRPID